MKCEGWKKAQTLSCLQQTYEGENSDGCLEDERWKLSAKCEQDVYAAAAAAEMKGAVTEAVATARDGKAEHQAEVVVAVGHEGREGTAPEDDKLQVVAHGDYGEMEKQSKEMLGRMEKAREDAMEVQLGKIKKAWNCRLNSWSYTPDGKRIWYQKSSPWILPCGKCCQIGNAKTDAQGSKAYWIAAYAGHYDGKVWVQDIGVEADRKYQAMLDDRRPVHGKDGCKDQDGRCTAEQDHTRGCRCKISLKDSRGKEIYKMHKMYGGFEDEGEYFPERNSNVLSPWYEWEKKKCIPSSITNTVCCKFGYKYRTIKNIQTAVCKETEW